LKDEAGFSCLKPLPFIALMVLLGQRNSIWPGKPGCVILRGFWGLKPKVIYTKIQICVHAGLNVK